MVMSFFGRQNRKQGSYRFLRGIALNGRPFPKHQPAGARADEKHGGKRFEVAGSSRWRSLYGFRFTKEIKVTSNRGAEIASLLKSEVQGSSKANAYCRSLRLIRIDGLDLEGGLRRLFRLKYFPNRGGSTQASGRGT